MKFNTELNGKASRNEAKEYIIEKVIELSSEEFESLCNKFFVLNDFVRKDYITKNKDLMYVDENDAIHCLLVLGEGENDGIVIESAGNDCARYTATISSARQIIEYESMSEPLKEYARVMTATVNDIVANALKSAENGKYSFFLDELDEDMGVPELNKALLIEMLSSREEFETVDDAGGEVMLYVKDEYLPEENNDEKYFDESYFTEIETICARHVLWIYDADGGERADFSNCKLTNVDFSNKNLNSATFKNAIIRNCNFADADLCTTDFDGAKIINSKFEHCTAEESTFKNTVFKDTNLSYGYFTHSNFTNARFENCVMVKGSLINCCLDSTDLNDCETTATSFNNVSYTEDEWLDENEDVGMTMS